MPEYYWVFETQNTLADGSRLNATAFLRPLTAGRLGHDYVWHWGVGNNHQLCLVGCSATYGLESPALHLLHVVSPFAREAVVCCSFPQVTVVVLSSRRDKAAEAESASMFLVSTLLLAVGVNHRIQRRAFAQGKVTRRIWNSYLRSCGDVTA